MNIQIDTTRFDTPSPFSEMEVFLNSGFQRTSANVGGMSFSSAPTLGKLLVATVIGTIPVAPVDLATLPNLGIQLVLREPDNTDDDYSRIRQEMIASGIPMLSDDELRREIRERKGGDLET